MHHRYEVVYTAAGRWAVAFIKEPCKTIFLNPMEKREGL